jgi:hypothetical protein
MKGSANALSQPDMQSLSPHIKEKILKVRNIDEKQVSNDDIKVLHILNQIQFRDSLRR